MGLTLESFDMAASVSEPPCTRVMYDGSCPLCTREIRLYQKLTPAQTIRWVDVSSSAQPLPAEVSRAQLMQRFHVLTAQGEWLDGAQAFVHLWQQLPGWRWLARLARLPGVLVAMEWLYRLFLRWRPAIQSWLKRRLAQRGRA